MHILCWEELFIVSIVVLFQGLRYRGCLCMYIIGATTSLLLQTYPSFAVFNLTVIIDQSIRFNRAIKAELLVPRVAVNSSHRPPSNQLAPTTAISAAEHHHHSPSHPPSYRYPTATIPPFPCSATLFFSSSRSSHLGFELFGVLYILLFASTSFPALL